jgi:hypothetical protein
MAAEWGGEAHWYQAQDIRDGSDQHQERAEEVRPRKAIITDLLVARSEEHFSLKWGRGSIDEPKVDIRVGHPTMV